MIRYKRIPENIDERMGLVADLLAGDPNVVFAYLFGGMISERRNPLSDVDIAIYVKSAKKLNFIELFNRVTNVLDTDEVDLVILNSSPVSLTGRILQSRRVLVDKDPFLRHKFESVTLRQFFDFQVKERDILQRRYGIG